MLWFPTLLCTTQDIIQTQIRPSNMSSDYKSTKHQPVKAHDWDYDGDHDEVDQRDKDEDEHHHSLPDHPPLESYEESSPLHKKSFFQTFRKAKSIFLGITLGCCILVGSLFLAPKYINSHRNNTITPPIKLAPLPPQNSEPITRIAFGSCINQNFPQTFWDTIASTHPNITILGGDNVYANCDSVETCPDTMAQAYQKQISNPSFMGAMEVLPIIAMLDNHDYGMDQANRYNPYKEIAKTHFLDFFQIPKEDVRRTRDGVYTSYAYGDFNQGTALQILVLDVRHACSEMGGPKDPNTIETVLGDAQWAWLEERYDEPANVRLVLSSIQLIATGHPFYSWRNISPKEQQRFYDFISSGSHTGTTIVLSGDRHVGGIYRHNLLTDDAEEGGEGRHPVNGKSNVLYDLTASSFTHTIPLPPYSPDDYCWNADGGTTSEDCDDPDPERLYPYVRENHFASLTFDWDARVVTADLVRSDNTLYSHAHHYNPPDSGDTLQSVEIEF